jgi:hypothetical protein
MGITNYNPSPEADVHRIVDLVRQRLPGLTVEQLQVRWPADDNGLWFFSLPNLPSDVQIESHTGNCPFLIEWCGDNTCFTESTPESTAQRVIGLLEQLGQDMDAIAEP